MFAVVKSVAGYGHFTGMGLLTANWFIGGAGIVVLVVILISRTPKEEAMMLATFGENYKRYAESTGRYLPRLRQNRHDSRVGSR